MPLTIVKQNPLGEDLDHILACTSGLWDAMRGQRLFITGGTGFIGCWLLESFAWANAKLDLQAQVTVLTRDPARFTRMAPHLAADPSITLLAGDVRDFAFTPGTFSHVIHAATDASVKLNTEAPLQMFDTIVAGTRRTLDFAVQSGAQKFLFLSSGAVYGPQPSTLTHIGEDYTGAPDPVRAESAYGEGKRVGEWLATVYAQEYGLQAKIARCFAFAGPYLPLDSHFAVGNFIRDALNGGPIRITGDGTTVRSYLYAADLAVWLWTILVRGATGRPYNTGSEVCQTIAETAQIVSSGCTPPPAIQRALQPDPVRCPARYVPSTQRARSELGLEQVIDACDTIKKTLAWCRVR